MKTIAALCLFLCVGIYASASDSTLPHVTALGTAVTRAQPDLLRWRISVSNQGTDVATVSDSHAADTTSLLRLLAEKGIRPEETQTSGMRLSEHREFRANSWVKDGYIAATDVSFTLRKLSDYRDLWIQLAKLGGVSVESVTWDVSNRIQIQDSTRIDALKAARAKAESMASVLGAKAAEPIEIIEEQPELPWANRNVTNRVEEVAGQGNSDEVLAPGMVNIRIAVRVSFRLVGGGSH